MESESHPLSHAPRRRRQRGAAALVVVLALFAIALALSLLLLGYGDQGMRHSSAMSEDATLHFLAVSGVNHAFAEVKDQTDYDGDGHFGAVGVATPAVLRDPENRPIGEYQAYVVNVAGDPAVDAPVYRIRVRVAQPSFANPLRWQTAEAAIGWVPDFALLNNLAAISVAGPLAANPDLADWNSSGFRVSGGDYPALIFTDPTARDNFLADGTIRNGWFSNGLDSKITGAPNVEIERPGLTPDRYEAPILLSEEAAFTAEMLNDYRDALRRHAQDLVYATEVGSGSTAGVAVDYTTATANGVVVLHDHPDVKDGAGTNKPRITSNLSLGTANVNSKVVLIDTSKFHQGHENMTSNHGDSGAGAATITGAGDLVILHPIGSRTDNTNGKMFNLNWTGNVYVIGYPVDRSTGAGNNARTDNLLYLSRADWNIQGNLMLLTAGDTEASLEARGSANGAHLNVDGGLLIFAEASGREAEIDIESQASMTVNGIVGVYGSRIEIENANNTTTDMVINGTLALGFPTDSTRTDDLKLQVRGNAQFNFDLGRVEDAAASLADLQAELDLSGSQLRSVDFRIRGMITRGAMMSGTAALAANSTSRWQLYASELSGLTSGDEPRGVDFDLVRARSGQQ